MDDPEILTLFERCLAAPLDCGLRLVLADRMENGPLAPLAAILRQSLNHDDPVLLTGNLHRAFQPLEWARDGWFGLDASFTLNLPTGPGSLLIGAIRFQSWDEQERMRLKLWRPIHPPAFVSLAPGGPIYPHLGEIFRWTWMKRITLLDLRSTFPGTVGLRAFVRSGNALQLKSLDLRANLLSPASFSVLFDWKGLKGLERLDLRENAGNGREWEDLIDQSPLSPLTRVLFDK